MNIALIQIKPHARSMQAMLGRLHLRTANIDNVLYEQMRPCLLVTLEF